MQGLRGVKSYAPIQVLLDQIMTPSFCHQKKVRLVTQIWQHRPCILLSFILDEVPC